MDKYVLLFTFRFCCVLKEKVSSLYGIVKWANFCYFSPFFLLCFQGESFIFVRLCVIWAHLCYFSPFILLCFEGESCIFVWLCVIWVHLCYFSPFVFVVFWRRKFYLCMTLLNRQIFVTFHLSFLLCFEGKSFIFVWHCVKWPHQHNVLLHNIVSATR